MDNTLLFWLCFQIGQVFIHFEDITCQQMSGSSKSELSFDEATNRCQTTDGTLIGPTDIYENFSILINNDTFWIKMRIARRQSLTWTTGSKVNGRSFHIYDAKCGVFNMKEKEMYEHPCLNLHYSLCQVRNCQDCPSDTQCFVHGENCYFSGSNKQNWYEGQTHCSSQGGRLAVFENREQLNIISVSNLPGVDVLWLGSRTIDWTMSDNSSQWIQRYNWLPGQPRYLKDCVVLSQEQGRLGWKSKNCKEKARIMCIRKPEKPAGTSESYAETKPLETEFVTQDSCEKKLVPTEDRQLLVPLIVVSAILVLVICSSCSSVIYVYQTRRKVQNENKKGKTTNRAASDKMPEENNLVNKDQI